MYKKWYCRQKCKVCRSMFLGRIAVEGWACIARTIRKTLAQRLFGGRVSLLAVLCSLCLPKTQKSSGFSSGHASLVCCIIRWKIKIGSAKRSACHCLLQKKATCHGTCHGCQNLNCEVSKFLFVLPARTFLTLQRYKILRMHLPCFFAVQGDVAGEDQRRGAHRSAACRSIPITTSLVQKILYTDFLCVRTGTVLTNKLLDYYFNNSTAGCTAAGSTAVVFEGELLLRYFSS